MIQNPSVGGSQNSEEWFTVPIAWERANTSSRAGGGINLYGSAQFDVPDGTLGFLCAPKAVGSPLPFLGTFCFVGGYKQSDWSSQSIASNIDMFIVDDVSVQNNHVTIRVGVDQFGIEGPLFIYPVKTFQEQQNL